MTNFVGSASWGIIPYSTNSFDVASMSYRYRRNLLKSANDQLRYQVQWFYAGLNEGTEVSFSGGVVNVIFKIESSVNSSEWTTLANIRKSRDISNRKYNSDLNQPPNGHRFTIDISQLAIDQLSYSLCPIGKGTWQSNYYGGMNGGLTMQDNVIGSNSAFGNPISEYNVSENGTFRILRVSATFEILQIDNTTGERSLVIAQNYFKAAPPIALINSVNQINDINYYENIYMLGESKNVRWQFLTRCPNWTDGSTKATFKKPVRIDEQAEWQQFFIFNNDSKGIRDPGGTPGDAVGATAIRIDTYDSSGIENSFYLRDFEDNILTHISYSQYIFQLNRQNQMFVQNVSPDYIINSGNVWLPDNSRAALPASNYPYWNAYTGPTITSNTTHYRAYLVKISMWSPELAGPPRRVTKVYEYTIDRESENIPYGFVRFHWLNSLGAIDSYTAKRDVVEGLTISRDVVERKSGDRTWTQAISGVQNGSEVKIENYPNGNKSYLSDTDRGGDTYKGGREVTNLDADRVQSVYTEPLNKYVAEWLEEMLLSPNVWIEKKSTRKNLYLRPSTKDYVPVIITNSEIETVNQSEGLVKFNIEYIFSHKIKTQRN